MGFIFKFFFATKTKAQKTAKITLNENVPRFQYPPLIVYLTDLPVKRLEWTDTMIRKYPPPVK